MCLNNPAKCTIIKKLFLNARERRMHKALPGTYVFRDGQECWHAGCSRHVSHPCEVCGRIGAKGEVTMTME